MNRLLHPMNDRLHVGLGTLGAVGTRLGDVLGSVGKPWVLPCDFDTQSLPKHCCRPCTPLHGNDIPRWLRPLSAA